jgi:predicted ATPase/DNA-binding XRE family transcriptional regulator
MMTLDDISAPEPSGGTDWQAQMVSHATGTLGPLLRRFRLAAGFSQEALARRANLNVTTIAALERGRHATPHPETVRLLAEALGLDATERAGLVAAATGLDEAPESASPAVPSGPIAAPPAARPISRLPVPLTPLIGREHEEAALTHLLRQESGMRLLTVTGLGGVGKTRLALAVAEALRESYADGVVFVDLSALRDPALVAPTIAQALGLREEGAHGLRRQLLAFLQSRHLLLVLDNVEQVVEAAPLVADLLVACPRLSVLATSRVALRLRMEQRFPVPPLATSTSRGADEEALGGNPAVRLFVARAQAVQPDFGLTAANRAIVAQICARLDGLPLAIELAAARIALLPPAALLARLEPRLQLKGGARDRPARQRTLRATIDWSFDLLDAGERRLFAGMAVFVGGCTLEAAEGVCEPESGLDGVASLLDKSLLAHIESGGHTRLSMLETLREYALERLESEGQADQMRRKHAGYYLAQAEASLSTFYADEAAWLDRWEREHDNVRAALHWARESGEVELGLRLAAVLWRLWYLHGHLSEGRAWLEGLLEQPGTAAPPVRAAVLRAAAILAVDQNDLQRAALWGEEALALFRAMGNDRDIAHILNTLGNIAREKGAYEHATTYYEQSLAIYRAQSYPMGVSVSLNNLGKTARYQGDLVRAATLHEESLALRLETGDLPGIAFALTSLGEVARDRGDLESSARYFEQALALRRELGDKHGSSRALLGLGDVARARGNTDHALTCYAEGLALSRATGDRWQTAFALEGLAWVDLMRGRAANAGRLLGQAATWRARDASTLLAAETTIHEHLVATIRETLGDVAFMAAWREGEMLPLEQVVGETWATTS